MLLIQPSCRERGKQIYPPFSLLSIASVPDKQGENVKIIDGNMIDSKEIKKIILKYGPKIVGFTSFTGSMLKNNLELSKFVKQNTSTTVVWGDIHTFLLPLQTIKEKYIYIVAVKERDYTFYEIYKNLHSLNKVRGIFYKKDNKIRKTPERELMDLKYNYWHNLKVSLLNKD